MPIERWNITTRQEWLARRRAANVITASEIGALFNCSPYLTPLALYLRKTGLVGTAENDNAVIKRGRVLEPAIAQAIREDYPDWTVENYGAFLWCPEWGIGCTPDFAVMDPERGAGIIQAKAVARFDEDWQDGPPQWIILQCLQEMMLTCVQWGAIAAFVLRRFNYELHLFPVQRHEPAEQKIVAAAMQFWRDVASGHEPSPDYAADGEIIKLRYPDDSGETVNLTGDNRMMDLLDAREKFSAEKNEAEKALKAINAEIAMKMRDATYAIVPGWETVSFKTQMRKGYTVEDTFYRILRAKRAKADAQYA